MKLSRKLQDEKVIVLSTFSGYKNGEYDLWRLKKEKTLQVSFIGDVRGAGLPEKDMFDYQGKICRLDSSKRPLHQKPLKVTFFFYRDQAIQIQSGRLEKRWLDNGRY